jgi:hypothetical protein
MGYDWIQLVLPHLVGGDASGIRQNRHHNHRVAAVAVSQGRPWAEAEVLAGAQVLAVQVEFESKL